MAKRRRLEAPGATELADIEAGFAAKPVPDRMGIGAPIAQVAADVARNTQPMDTAARVALARDATDAVAFRTAVEEGRVVSNLPLDAIDLDHLIRDRMVVEAAEMQELKASILAHGLRLPIEVVALPQGRFGLVSGWRRVTALQQIRAENGDSAATVKAIVRAPYEAGAIYTAMVEENELRTQLTPYERGRIAVLAAQQGAFATSDLAIDAIYGTASKSKRSKIRSFALIHAELGDMLRYPTDLSERNGLRLAMALRLGCAAALRMALVRAEDGGPAQEWAAIEGIIAGAEAAERVEARGGRPRNNSVPPAGHMLMLASGISMERVSHADGYSIRLRGDAVNADLVDMLMQELQSVLDRL